MKNVVLHVALQHRLTRINERYIILTNSTYCHELWPTSYLICQWLITMYYCFFIIVEKHSPIFKWGLTISICMFFPTHPSPILITHDKLILFLHWKLPVFLSAQHFIETFEIRSSATNALYSRMESSKCWHKIVDLW